MPRAASSTAADIPASSGDPYSSVGAVCATPACAVVRATRIAIAVARHARAQDLVMTRSPRLVMPRPPRHLLRQDVRDQPARLLHEHVLASLVHPAGHAVPALARDG